MKNFYNRLKINQPLPWQRLRRWLNEAWPCPLCGSALDAKAQPAHHIVCRDCVASLPWYLDPRCPQCALPNPLGALCGSCLQSPPAFDRTLTAFRYAYPLDRLLQQFKYHQQLAWGALLMQLMLAEQSFDIGLKPDILIPMPMHPARLQQRGFHHASMLASHLQQQTGLTVDGMSCVRLLDTPTQAGLDLKTRTRNLRGAFACHRQWQGQHLMVVDDVMTTGASMHALASVLKKAGAGSVTALVVARTLKA